MSVSDAFAKILFDLAFQKPRRLQTDNGKKFFNFCFKGFMKQNFVKHYASEKEPENCDSRALKS